MLVSGETTRNRDPAANVREGRKQGHLHTEAGGACWSPESSDNEQGKQSLYLNELKNNFGFCV